MSIPGLNKGTAGLNKGTALSSDESPPAALLPAGNRDGSYCTPADSGDGSSAASRKEKAGLLFGRLSENDQDLILQMLRRLVIGYGSS